MELSHTPHAVVAGQFKGQFSGAMEELSRQGQKASVQYLLR